MKKDYFINEQTKLNQEIKSLQQQSKNWSLLRLISGLLVIILLLVGYFNKREYLYFGSLVSLILFSYFVIKHHQLNLALTYKLAKNQVIQRYLDRSNQAWKAFKQDELENINGVMYDLDIGGKNSLYQYLNTAFSKCGKQKLLEKLTRTTFSLKQICLEQGAVKELGDNPAFVVAFETMGKLAPEHENKVVKPIKYHHNIFGYVLPIATIIDFSLFLCGFKLALAMLPFFIFGQWLIALINYVKNSEVFMQMSNLSKELKSKVQLCHLINTTNFHDPYLLTLKDNLKEAQEGFKSLQTISSAMKQRNNLLAFLLLNGLLSWDLNCNHRYQTWYQQYGKQVASWLETIGELESLVSLGVLLQTKEVTCFPNLSDGEMELSFQGAYHPLIDDEKVVANTFTMDKQVCLITGSNMSGKTTFLRTIGINLVLAYAGAPVMAQSFSCSLMQIFTSMRIADNIEGVSSYYAELLRIKEIVQANRQGIKMIALIDEIFKGTNSKDRIAGAMALVKQLASQNIFTFITTHDFELCELSQVVSCGNYHFSEDYVDNQIVFDYLLKKGQAKTTNGQYLLKMVGIID